MNIGAHRCFFCLIAALSDYPVYSFEPLPQCVRDNKKLFPLYPQTVCDKVTLYNYYVSDRYFQLATPNNVCSGVFNQHDQMREALLSEKDETTLVTSLSIAATPVSRNDIYILAIDTEGAELDVLRSAKRIFQKRKVYNMFIEYTSSGGESSSLPASKQLSS